ncbi:MAG: hypothetical protein K9M11_03735 [Candidatus Pacebacteria bacterium]|nr:hypothetical protein [Candidatus Paceibacterota bacterium]
MKAHVTTVQRLFFLLVFCAALGSIFFSTYVYADRFNWVQRVSSVYADNWTSAVVSDDHAYLFAAHGSELMRSPDGGATWTTIYSFSSGEFVTDIAVSSNGQRVAVTTSGGAYYDSTSYGSGLSKRLVGDFRTTALSSDGTQIIFSSVYTIFYSPNSGNTFSHASGVAEISAYDSVMARNSSRAYLIASGSCLYVSNDQGASYSSLSCGGYTHVAASADGSYVLVSSYTGDNGARLHLSSDYGATLNVLTSAPSLSTAHWTSLSMSGSGSYIVAVSSAGGVYVSIDFGSSWTQEVSAPQSSLWNAISLSSDAYSIVGASSDAYIWTATYDSTPPNIVNISSSLADGSYTVGQEIPITVTLDKSAFGASSLTLTLETGAVDRTCDMSIDNTNVGICTYAVQAGDTTSDLSVFNVSGVLRNQNGYNRSSGFANISSFASNKAIQIDTTSPEVTLTTPSTGSSVSGIVSLVATSSDANLVGVQFKYNSLNIGDEITSDLYEVNWDTSGLSNGTYTVDAVARDVAGNTATSSITVTVNNSTTPAAPEEAADAPTGVGSIVTVNTFKAGSTSVGSQNPSNYVYLNQVITQSNSDVKNEASKRLEDRNIPHGFNFLKDLSVGSVDGDVQNLQRMLNLMGYTVTTQGGGSVGYETTYFGTNTKKALVNLQTTVGISPSRGYFGRITRTFLNRVLNIIGY